MASWLEQGLVLVRETRFRFVDCVLEALVKTRAELSLYRSHFFKSSQQPFKPRGGGKMEIGHLGLSFLSDSEGSSQSVGSGLEAGLC